MHSFKVGDKVRNKVTGDILEFAGYSDNKGVRYAKCRIKGLSCDMLKFCSCTYWNIGDCEQYFENMPILASERMPEDVDYDKKGWVIAKTTDGCMKCVSKSFIINSPKQVISWWKTPDWTLHEPLMECCGDCEHVGYEGIDRGSTVCWKHCIFSPKPHHKGSVPCHLAGKDNA